MAEANRTCSFDPCEKNSIGRKPYCIGHLRQSERGVPLAPLRPRRKPYVPLHVRLAARTRITPTCWLWTGTVSPNGYGSMWGDEGQMSTAHRVAFELAHGKLPQGVHVDHTCRNRLCVNPAHLRAATNKQNHENLGIAAHNTSGVRGVHWSSDHSKWCARVTHNRKTFHAGYFDSLEDAAAAAVAKRNELFTHNIENESAVL